MLHSVAVYSSSIAQPPSIDDAASLLGGLMSLVAETAGRQAKAAALSVAAARCSSASTSPETNRTPEDDEVAYYDGC